MSLLSRWFGFSRDEIFDEAMAAYDRGDFEEAADAFAQCMEDAVDPSERRLARFYWAQAQAELGHERLRALDPEGALRHLHQALRLYPSFPDLNLSAAKAYRALGDRSRQSEYADRAVRSNPRHVEAILFQGITWYECGRHEDAFARVNYACQLDPNLSQERFTRALELHSNGDGRGALRELLALASFSSADAYLHVRVGDSFMRDHRLTEAISEYGKALEVAPDYCDAHCRLGRALLMAGEAELAAEHLRQALELNPGQAEAHAQLGLAYQALHRTQEAQREFQEALSLNPDHPIGLRYRSYSPGYAA